MTTSTIEISKGDGRHITSLTDAELAQELSEVRAERHKFMTWFNIDMERYYGWLEARIMREYKRRADPNQSTTDTEGVRNGRG